MIIRGARDYGMLQCFASNSVGHQTEPCTATIIPSGNIIMMIIMMMEWCKMENNDDPDGNSVGHQTEPCTATIIPSGNISQDDDHDYGIMDDGKQW